MYLSTKRYKPQQSRHPLSKHRDRGNGSPRLRGEGTEEPRLGGTERVERVRDGESLARGELTGTG